MPLSLEIIERALCQNLHKSALDWKWWFCLFLCWSPFWWCSALGSCWILLFKEQWLPRGSLCKNVVGTMVPLCCWASCEWSPTYRYPINMTCDFDCGDVWPNLFYDLMSGSLNNWVCSVSPLGNETDEELGWLSDVLWSSSAPKQGYQCINIWKKGQDYKSLLSLEIGFPLIGKVLHFMVKKFWTTQWPHFWSSSLAHDKGKSSSWNLTNAFPSHWCCVNSWLTTGICECVTLVRCVLLITGVTMVRFVTLGTELKKTTYQTQIYER